MLKSILKIFQTSKEPTQNELILKTVKEFLTRDFNCVYSPDLSLFEINGIDLNIELCIKKLNSINKFLLNDIDIAHNLIIDHNQRILLSSWFTVNDRFSNSNSNIKIYSEEVTQFIIIYNSIESDANRTYTQDNNLRLLSTLYSSIKILSEELDNVSSKSIYSRS